MRGMLLAACLVMGLCTGAPAGASRTLDAPDGKNWTHGATHLALPPAIGTLKRSGIVDSGTAELDIMAQYATPDSATILTAYLFRPALASAAIWFDRSQAMIEARDIYQGVTAVTSAPIAFARPGSGTKDVLRRTYVPRGGAYRSTALAMIPVGNWLFALRISSTAMDDAAMDALLDTAIAGVAFPANTPAGPAAAAVAGCAEPLYFSKASAVKPDMSLVLLAATQETMRGGGDGAADAGAWCREASDTVAYGIYRHPGEKDRYVIALGDAGIVASVSPEVPLLMRKPGVFVTLRELDGSRIYPAFDHLPSPDQAIDLVMHGAPLASVRDKAISLDSSLMSK
ncbi:hypothetical protein [Flavisphingomonas formosensis]|uniref:hypothetical protein n=1 Tax=Flavisphingomonas formosensis TaxID=861534 RepID=UPI0012F917B3|nr:hypothetical protein [Sphingomonas formosensis]